MDIPFRKFMHMWDEGFGRTFISSKLSQIFVAIRPEIRVFKRIQGKKSAPHPVVVSSQTIANHLSFSIRMPTHLWVKYIYEGWGLFSRKCGNQFNSWNRCKWQNNHCRSCLLHYCVSTREKLRINLWIILHNEIEILRNSTDKKATEWTNHKNWIFTSQCTLSFAMYIA